MRTILVMPIGTVDRKIPDRVVAAFKEAFACAAEPGESIPVPEKTYNTRRRQYNSTRILKALEPLKPDGYDFLLAVIDGDSMCRSSTLFSARRIFWRGSP